MIDLKVILSEIFKEIKMATIDSRHSFRYPVLATTHKGALKQRVVILRKWIDEELLVFYSDSRTQKVAHIKNHPIVSICFFDSGRKTQVQINGTATLSSEFPLDLEDHQKSDYNSEKPPGTKIVNLDELSNISELHFSKITVMIESIDWLQLSREGHRRAKFAKNPGGAWTGSYVVP